jgi:CheY-like chemotaxis protein
MGTMGSVHGGVMNSDQPFLNGREVQATLAQALLEVPSALLGVSVFLAEDEPVLVWALEEVLGELGCKVVGSAARVTDAMAFVAQHTFDVAVLDGTLADGDIDRVVELLMARGVPFILSSGRSSCDVTKKYRHAVVLQKPYKDIELRQALLLALAQGKAERKPVS